MTRASKILVGLSTLTATHASRQIPARNAADPTMARRSRGIAVFSALTLVATGGVVWAPSASAVLPAECVQAGPTTVVCTYTSGTSAFTVPAGVSSLHVLAIGGKGADGGKPTESDAIAAPGGRGARVEGDVSVQAGSVVFPVVGGNGSGSDGGANGGGAGCSSPVNAGGGGGGASDLRTSSSLFSRVIVAAGGGGGGCAAFGPEPGAGGSWALAGGDATSQGGSGGQAGTATLGGAGGAGGQTGIGPETANDVAGSDGQDGSFGFGGNGGDTNSPRSDSSGGGGGGGAGWTGGGGGGGGAYMSFREANAAGGGGGGGWNLVPAGGSAVSDTTSVPKVVLTYSTASSGGGSQTGTPVFSATPSSVNFPNQLVKKTTPSIEVTVRNNGSGQLTISSTTLAGTYPGDYIITANNCGTPVAPGANCKVSVAFRPTAIGARPALLRFADNAPGTPHDVTLNGRGCNLLLGQVCF